MKRSQKSGPTAGKKSGPTAGEKSIPNSRAKEHQEHSQLQARTSQDKVNYDKENDNAMKV